MNTTRHSPKREAILECLRSTTCHPSAEWVYAQLKPRIPDLSLATVYRNLARFRAEGAVQVIGCVDGEDRYDGDTAPHGHFVCRTCGAVDEVDDHAVSAALDRAAAAKGFRPGHATVEVEGTCAGCAASTPG